MFSIAEIRRIIYYYMQIVCDLQDPEHEKKTMFSFVYNLY